MHDCNCSRIKSDMFLSDPIGRFGEDLYTILPTSSKYCILSSSSLSLTLPTSFQGKYLDNHFSGTKFCAMSFKGAHKELKKAERVQLRETINRAKTYADLDDFVGGVWNGDEEMLEIIKSIESRVNGTLYPLDPPPSRVEQMRMEDKLAEEKAYTVLVGVSAAEAATDATQPLSTPPELRENPEPDTLSTPRLPLNERLAHLPSLISGQDFPTPTPTPAPGSCRAA